MWHSFKQIGVNSAYRGTFITATVTLYCLSNISVVNFVISRGTV